MSTVASGPATASSSRGSWARRTYYVGQLTGFPFPPGGANVWRVKPGHDPQVFKGGFTNIIDIAFDKRGRLYVLEIATGGLLNTLRTSSRWAGSSGSTRTAARPRWPARA
jgi:hypothetical protein